jgi:hypothetical protein
MPGRPIPVKLLHELGEIALGQAAFEPAAA